MLLKFKLCDWIRIIRNLLHRASEEPSELKSFQCLSQEILNMTFESLYTHFSTVQPDIFCIFSGKLRLEFKPDCYGLQQFRPQILHLYQQSWIFQMKNILGSLWGYRKDLKSLGKNKSVLLFYPKSVEFLLSQCQLIFLIYLTYSYSS